MTALLFFSVTDLAERRIPKNLNILLVAALEFTDERSHGFVIWLIYVGIFRLSRGGVGYGDVRLAPVALLVSDGFGGAMALHILAWVLGGVFLATIVHRKHENLPFAPFLWLSALIMNVS